MNADLRSYRNLAAALAAVVIVLVVAAISIKVVQRTSRPGISFLGWDENGRVQLFRVGLSSGAKSQLTYAPSDVESYSLSPDGQRIAYSYAVDNGGSEFWLVDSDGGGDRKMLDCSNAICIQPVWHPDGRRFVYEKREIGADGIPSFPSLWWLDTRDGASVPLLEETGRVSQAASFSPSGDWVTFAGSPDEGIIAYNIESGQHFVTASEMGTPASWGPLGDAFIIRNHQVVVSHGEDDGNHSEHEHDFTLAVHLFLVSVEDGSVRPLSDEDLVVDDGSPVWSPDGAWIAVGRKQPRTEMGRQLWLLSTDGHTSKALTNESETHYGAPSWSTDGRSLLFQAVDALDRNAKPRIWLMEVDSGRRQLIVNEGFRPTWLR